MDNSTRKQNSYQAFKKGKDTADFVQNEHIIDMLGEIAGKLNSLGEKNTLLSDEPQVVTIKGKKGDDADPAEVADILKKDKEFLSKTKGDKGDAPTAIEIAKEIKKDDKFAAKIKGEPGKPGNDGLTPKYGKDFDFKEELKDLKYEIKTEVATDAITIIEAMQGDDRLDAQKLKNLPEFDLSVLDELRDQIKKLEKQVKENRQKNIVGGGGGGNVKIDVDGNVYSNVKTLKFTSGNFVVLNETMSGSTLEISLTTDEPVTGETNYVFEDDTNYTFQDGTNYEF